MNCEFYSTRLYIIANIGLHFNKNKIYILLKTKRYLYKIPLSLKGILILFVCCCEIAAEEHFGKKIIYTINNIFLYTINN